VPIKVLSHFRGLGLGAVTDRYEVAIAADRGTILRRLHECFRPLGYTSVGHAYDGSYIFTFSPRHEIAVWIRKETLRFEDRFRPGLRLRIRQSQLRRKLPWIVAPLLG